MPDVLDAGLPDPADPAGSADPADPAWGQFRTYLEVQHGIKPATAVTYASQVKRILAAVPDLTTPALNAWIKQFPSNQRTPFRASWRKFRLYFVGHYGITLADFSRLSTENMPAEVQEAIRDCVKNHKVKPQVLSDLTTDLDFGPRYQALRATLPGLQAGVLVLGLTHDGRLASIPADAHTLFCAWGQQNQRTSGTRWLLPASPGGDIAMTPAQIGKLLKPGTGTNTKGNG
jgi:hypothetical protein